MKISGNIVDVLNKRIFPGTIETSGQRIKSIKKDNKKYNCFILPGFIDSHIHIESSMLIPSEFARLAVIHGTVAAVSDPHEIANVLGLKGIKHMINNGKKSDFRFYFGAPSCVPSTSFETSGAKIGAKQIEKLLKNKNIKYLSEMMNFPGVINNNKEVISKINIAKKYKKLIDGHAPGLRGKNIKKYFSKGISTDHECFEIKEAIEKIRLGVKIQIREGSAAKNFNALVPLIKKYPESCMLCSDDKHPDELVKGQINELVKRAIKKGIDKISVLRCACVNPALHYGLDIGLLRKNDYADFIVIDNFKRLNVLKVFIKGKL